MMPNNLMMAGPQFFQNLQLFKSNPLKFLLQRGFNIPESVGTDPNAIMQHLVQTGQVSQEQINSAYQMAQRFRR